MSQTDSFIDEVTEEVERDKLYGYLRRYGWIAIVLVLAIVLGAAWSEWSASRAEAAAQDTGDAIIAALESDDRITGLSAIETTGGAEAVRAMIVASEQLAAEDPEAAYATLSAVAENAEVPQRYRQYALMKSLMLGTLEPAERKAALAPLAVPGQPYRLIAAEQIVLADLDLGDTEAAVAGLRAILEDAEVTQALRDRASSLMIALGEDLSDDGAQSDGAQSAQ